jgi:hypothetical protein
LAHGSSGNILKGLLQGSGCCPGFQGWGQFVASWRW